MLKKELESLLNAQPHSPIGGSKYLRPGQVPRLYPVSRATVYQWLTDGHVKSMCVRKPGNIHGARFISVASIEAFLAKLAHEQKGEKFIPAVEKSKITGRRDRVASEDTEKIATESEASTQPPKRGRGWPSKAALR